MMRQNRYFIVAIITLFLSLVVMSCEDFADQTYELTPIDAAAIASISDTLENSLIMKSATVLSDGSGIILTGGGIDTALMSIDTTVALEQGDIYNAMIAVGIDPVTVNDTVYSTTIRSDSLCYQLIESETSGTHVFYMDYFVAVNIYDGSGNMVTMESDDMSPELIAGLYDVDGPVPIVKGRYEYDLNVGIYLFEIARLEATVEDNFRTVFMRE